MIVGGCVWGVGVGRWVTDLWGSSRNLKLGLNRGGE